MEWVTAVLIVLLAARVAVPIGREATLPRGQVSYGASWKTRQVLKSKKNPLAEANWLQRLTGMDLVFAATGALIALVLLLLTPLI